jgi:hypothetical protein
MPKLGLAAEAIDPITPLQAMCMVMQADLWAGDYAGAPWRRQRPRRRIVTLATLLENRPVFAIRLTNRRLSTRVAS